MVEGSKRRKRLGVDCKKVILSCRMMLDNLSGMALIEGWTMTSLAPDDRPKKRSTTLGSNVNGEAMRMESSGAIRNSSLRSEMLGMMQLWYTLTALGFPVLPDVWMT